MLLRSLRRNPTMAAALLGLVGGAVAFTVGEPVMFQLERWLMEHGWLRTFMPTPDVPYAAVLGLYLGFFLGAAEGLLALDCPKLARGMVFGGIAGLVGGAIGSLLGEIAFEALGKSSVGRFLGWAVFGALLGVSPGLALKAVDRAARGFLGGLVGGFGGGMIFSFAASLFSDPQLGRCVSIPLLRAVLGACYGLVETLMRRAWVTVLSGPAEGYEYAIGARAITIGSGTRADVRVGKDVPGLALELALVPAGIRLRRLDVDQVTVNHTAVEECVLADGDVIRVRGVRVMFSQKDGRQAAAAPVESRAGTVGGAAVPAQAQAPSPAPGGGGAASTARPEVREPAPAARPAPAPAAPAPAPRRAAVLEGLGEPVEGRRVPLDRDRITIGRDDDNDVVIDHLSVSLKHAEIVRKGKLLVLLDRGSSNGTFVQGRRIQENALKPGFVVEIGLVRFRYVEQDQA